MRKTIEHFTQFLEEAEIEYGLVIDGDNIKFLYTVCDVGGYYPVNNIQEEVGRLYWRFGNDTWLHDVCLRLGYNELETKAVVLEYLISRQKLEAKQLFNNITHLEASLVTLNNSIEDSEEILNKLRRT